MFLEQIKRLFVSLSQTFIHFKYRINFTAVSKNLRYEKKDEFAGEKLIISYKEQLKFKP